LFLTDLKIKNFRSIGEDGLELSFSTNLTTLLGENNVGKSSIFKAIKKILESPSNEWIPEEWHAGNQKQLLEIQIDCNLDDLTIAEIIESMRLPITIDQYKIVFSNKITYIISRNDYSLESSLKFGVFQLNRSREGNHQVLQGWIGEKGRKNHTYGSAIFNDFFTSVFLDNKPLDFIKDHLDKQTINYTTRSYGITLPNTSWDETFIKIIQKRLVIIEDFREKPEKGLSNFLATSTGKDLSSVLFNLKNGKDTEETFFKIQKNFESLFPNIKMNVYRDLKTNKEIDIYFTKDQIRSTTSFVGAGILESLLLLTHLEAYKNHIFLIDHPETHLHPHAQRSLNSILEKNNDNQVLIITHSPYFVNFNKKSRIVRLSQKSHKTIKDSLPDDFFTDLEFTKIDQFLDSANKELFFARKVILVEGATEIGALPIFANASDFNLDDYGISLINVDGKKNFPFFSKICEAFKIPYVMLADYDAREIIDKIKEQFRDSKSIILPKDFEALLPQELREASKLKYGESKPRIGRYVAQQMIEKEISVPVEIQHLFSQLR
jgi:putative ATP-dependent endonuclease of the OLD family